MASLTIDALDDAVARELRARAEVHGTSPAEEARAILAATLGAPVKDNLADAIAALTDPLGGVYLDIPGRTRDREPPFGEFFWDTEGPDEEDPA